MRVGHYESCGVCHEAYCACPRTEICAEHEYPYAPTQGCWLCKSVRANERKLCENRDYQEGCRDTLTRVLGDLTLLEGGHPELQKHLREYQRMLSLKWPDGILPKKKT